MRQVHANADGFHPGTLSSHIGSGEEDHILIFVHEDIVTDGSGHSRMAQVGSFQQVGLFR